MSEMLIAGEIDAALAELRKPEAVAAMVLRSKYQDEAGLRKYIKRRFPQARIEITERDVLIRKKNGRVYPWVVAVHRTEKAGADEVTPRNYKDGILRRAAAGMAAIMRPGKRMVDGGKDFKSPVRYGEGGR